jgi:hypothetical protein
MQKWGGCKIVNFLLSTLLMTVLDACRVSALASYRLDDHGPNFASEWWCYCFIIPRSRDQILVRRPGILTEVSFDFPQFLTTTQKVPSVFFPIL